MCTYNVFIYDSNCFFQSSVHISMAMTSQLTVPGFGLMAKLFRIHRSTLWSLLTVSRSIIWCTIRSDQMVGLTLCLQTSVHVCVIRHWHKLCHFKGLICAHGIDHIIQTLTIPKLSGPYEIKSTDYKRTRTRAGLYLKYLFLFVSIKRLKCRYSLLK